MLTMDAAATVRPVAAVRAADPARPARDIALDLVKGSLVIVMVLYHWLNYFVTTDFDIYRYLRFLTPSFILITGFVVSRVYLGRYAYDSPLLRRRLVERGAKLLLLFVALNLIVELALGTRLAASWPTRAAAIFLAGDKEAAFTILVPIGYFLLLAPFVLLVSRRTGVTLAAIAAGALTAVAAASLAGYDNFNLEMLSIALLGLAAGAAEPGRIDALAARLSPLVAGYVVYLVAISVWNVRFPLQVVGVCLSVLLILLMASRWRHDGPVRQSVADLGKYSLFSYIVQIGLLQLLRRALRAEGLSGVELLVPFTLGIAGTILAVKLAAVVRSRSPFADRLYRAVLA